MDTQSLYSSQHLPEDYDEGYSAFATNIDAYDDSRSALSSAGLKTTSLANLSRKQGKRKYGPLKSHRASSMMGLNNHLGSMSQESLHPPSYPQMKRHSPNGGMYYNSNNSLTGSQHFIQPFHGNKQNMGLQADPMGQAPQFYQQHANFYQNAAPTVHYQHQQSPVRTSENYSYETRRDEGPITPESLDADTDGKLDIGDFELNEIATQESQLAESLQLKLDESTKEIDLLKQKVRDLQNKLDSKTSLLDSKEESLKSLEMTIASERLQYTSKINTLQSQLKQRAEAPSKPDDIDKQLEEKISETAKLNSNLAHIQETYTNDTNNLKSFISSILLNESPEAAFLSLTDNNKELLQDIYNKHTNNKDNDVLDLFREQLRYLREHVECQTEAKELIKGIYHQNLSAERELLKQMTFKTTIHSPDITSSGLHRHLNYHFVPIVPSSIVGDS
ncbi:BA75_02089T0 [Komagataella pastoris]|uniref:BA75_02089T0 n=1 Tax=Komagataella pastoris TaxID=4922 RepID=A0A1B2JC87_PICPA|nr:BA75_02089T0 [Komagataella pastoris]